MPLTVIAVPEAVTTTLPSPLVAEPMLTTLLFPSTAKVTEVVEELVSELN